MKDFFQIFLPNILVMVGWYVIYRQTLTMKRREDLSLIVQKSTDLVEEIYHLTIAYFSDDTIEPIGHESAEIRSKALLLSHYLMLLKARVIEGEVGKYLNNFRKSSMANFFENQSKNEQKTLLQWKSDLANSKSELIFRINNNFFSSFHPSKRLQ